MIYLKIVSNGYVMSVLKAEYQSDIDGVPITEAEYSNIQNAMKSIPPAVDSYARKLRADTLEWELVELPPIEPEPLTDGESITRYANELTGAEDADLISATETLIQQRMEE